MVFINERILRHNVDYVNKKIRVGGFFGFGVSWRLLT